MKFCHVYVIGENLSIKRECWSKLKILKKKKVVDKENAHSDKEKLSQEGQFISLAMLRIRCDHLSHRKH